MQESIFPLNNIEQQLDYNKVGPGRLHMVALAHWTPVSDRCRGHCQTCVADHLGRRICTMPPDGARAALRAKERILEVCPRS